MHAAIEPGDRKLLILAGALLAAVSGAAVLLSPSSVGGSPAHASSYSTAGEGAKAAYELLGESGYTVERWSRSPEDLPADAANTVLILADPLIPPEARDRSSLRAFLGRGGRVLATEAGGARLLSQERLMPKAKNAEDWQLFSAEQPAPLTRGAPQVVMKSTARWLPPLDSQQRYYGDERGAVVMGYAVGKGEVIWWAGSTPLTNYGLKQASNLALFLNSVGPAGAAPHRVRVLWDEYFHGQRSGFWAYAGRTPVPWALAQLAVLAAAALLTYARRSGPVRPLPASGSRLSPLEFVETVGDLYERKGAAAGALGIAYGRFRSLAARRLALSPRATAQEIYRGARQRLGWNVPGFWETLDRSERGVRSSELPDSQALRLVRELHDYGRRFRLTSYH